MTELEDRIIKFAAEEQGMKSEGIELSSRLSDDLGMDGDDAVDFFEKFGKKFSVDLELLWQHWRRHFGPEFSGPSLGAIVLIVACVILGDLLHRAFNRIPGWAAMIALIVGAVWTYNRFFADRNPNVIPVTVGDLVDAAKARKWVKQYDDDGATMFRTIG
jgi:acyl carrier protein